MLNSFSRAAPAISQCIRSGRDYSKRLSRSIGKYPASSHRYLYWALMRSRGTAKCLQNKHGVQGAFVINHDECGRSNRKSGRDVLPVCHAITSVGGEGAAA